MKTIAKFPKTLLIAVFTLWWSSLAAQTWLEMLLHDAVTQPGQTVVIHMELQNEIVIAGLQFDVSLPDGFSYIAGSAVLNPQRKIDHLIQGSVLPGTNVLRIISFSLMNHVFPGSSGILASFTLQAPEQQGIYMLDVINNFMNNSHFMGSAYAMSGSVLVAEGFQQAPGDANCDETVNVMDVVATANHILGNYLQPFCFENADVNSNWSVDAADIISMVNIILSSGTFECGTSTVSDSDGNVYNTMLIGNLCWMTENLKTTHYRNGIPIEYPVNNSAWQSNTSGAYSWYGNDIAWKNSYGALYNWYAVNNVNGLCPEGWHIPSESEWNRLTYGISGSTISGGNRMKSCRQVNSPLGGDCNTTEYPRWDADSINYGTDDYGFNGLPGSSRQFYGDYYYLHSLGHWWTTTETDSVKAYSRRLHFKHSTTYRENVSKANGFSVRCVRF